MRFLRRSERTDPVSPDALLEQLLAASAADDQASMIELCERHGAVIEASWEDWGRLPAATDPSVIMARGFMLAKVQRILADAYGQTDLVARTVVGSPLGARIAEAHRIDELIEDDRLEEAAAAAQALAEQIRDADGGGQQGMLAKAVGRIATARFNAGDVAGCLQPLEQAWSLSVDDQDAEGQSAYAHGLYEANRYLGHAEAAARWCRRRADLLARADDPDAAWLERQARIVAAGEPPLRVVAIVDGLRFELDDLEDIPAPAERAGVRFGFVYQRDRPAIRRSEHRAAEGKRAASRGDLDRGLELLEAASAIDPYDPDPVYNAGVVLLDAHRFTDARAAFERVNVIAPGWFHAHSYAWLAAEVAAGRLEPAVSDLLIRVAEVRYPEGQATMQRALERWPTLGWLHQLDGLARYNAGDRPGAEWSLREALDLGLPDDVRAWAELALASVTGDRDERTRLLEGLIGETSDLRPAAWARVYQFMDRG